MRAPTACAYLAFMTCDICVNPWHVRSMLSFSFAIDSSSDPPSEIEHGKFSSKAPFECTGCPLTVCLLLRLPVAPVACCSECLFISCLFTGCLSSDNGFIITEVPGPSGFLPRIQGTFSVRVLCWDNFHMCIIFHGGTNTSTIITSTS